MLDTCVGNGAIADAQLLQIRDGSDVLQPTVPLLPWYWYCRRRFHHSFLGFELDNQGLVAIALARIGDQHEIIGNDRFQIFPIKNFDIRSKGRPSTGILLPRD